MIADNLWQDLRFAARQLRLNPGFAAVSILSLALGVGANSAIFQLLDAIRLRALPVPNAAELAEVKIADKTKCCSGNFSARRSELTNPQWEQIRDKQQGFSSIMAWSDRRFDLSSGGQAQYAEGIFVSASYFSTLQVPAILGRVFTREDDRPGCGSPGAVIGYGFWQKQFAGDPGVLGKKLTLEGHPFEVIGVTPANFFGTEVGSSYEVAVPLCSDAVISSRTRLDRRDGWWLSSIGRLKPGWTLERANAQLKSISAGIFGSTVPPGYRVEQAKNYEKYYVGAVPAGTGVSNLRSRYESPLLLLVGIAGLVLAIACANLANLMLARASVREREMAVRLAVGASRPQIVRQLLVESLLIAAIGAGLGAWIAQYLSRVLVAFLSTGDNPLFLNLGVDWRVLGFTAGIAIAACVLFGLAPAIRASGGNPADAMRSGRGQTAGREKFSLRRALAASQIALSLVLVASALLFTRSLQNLMTMDAGFRQEGVLIAGVDLTRAGMAEPQRAAAYKTMLDGLRAGPGVEGAATVDIVPISGNGWNQNFRLDGPAGKNKGELMSDFNRVSAGYFATMGTPIAAGRDFNAHDTLTAPNAAIVDEAFCKKFLNGAAPVGITLRRIEGRGTPDTVFQIVGVTRSMKYRQLQQDFTPTIFVAASQQKEVDTGETFVVRSRLPLETVSTEVKELAKRVHPAAGLDFRVLRTAVTDSLLRERLMAMLSGLFGILAVVLATIGLYGVISYMVARRQNEIGIRMALGAGPGCVLRLVLVDAGLLLAVGLAAGTALTVAVSRLASTLVFGVKPNDPYTIAAAGLGLAAVAFLASYIPARRAARLDPMTTLRAD